LGTVAAVRRVRDLARLSWPAVAWWTWRHRDEVIDWAHFGVRSTRKLLNGDRSDPVVEARVRAALANDPRTRRASGLRVEVHDGVVQLHGAVTPEVRDVAHALAGRTNGVTRVDDRVDIVGRRRLGFGH
jgi:osmotically-inducible protein OsmY